MYQKVNISILRVRSPVNGIVPDFWTASTKFTSVLSFGLDVSRPDKLNPPSDKYDRPNLNVKIFKMRTEILLNENIFWGF